METKYIAAIEIASSKIKGAIGSVGSDGRLSVLAVEETPSGDNVRYGRVQNIREVSAAVNDIIQRLESAPAVAPRQIRALAVSIGGRSLSSTPAKSSAKFADECEVTEKHVQRLIFDAMHNFVSDKYVIEPIPRMFYVNNSAVRQPVGTFCDSLRGEFLMITCSRETRQNLERIKFDTIAPTDVKYIIETKATGDFVLTADEKELGTALVDIGSETTTVVVYKDGTLAFASTIPMGSRLLTLDLVAGLGTTEEAAEKLKREIAADQSNNEEAHKYIHSRAGEIIANVLNQVDTAGLGAPAISKIVVTGGGAATQDFIAQLSAQFKIPVRVAEMPAEITFRVPGRNNSSNIDIVALLAAAGKSIADSCLTEERTDDDSVVYSSMEPVESDMVVIDGPRLEPVPEKKEETAHDDPDDDTLFDDDPDEPEVPKKKAEQKEDTKEKHSFSFFGKKKKKVEEEPEQEVPEEEPEEPEENDDPDNYNRVREKLGGWQSKLAKFFAPTEGYEKDEDDE